MKECNNDIEYLIASVSRALVKLGQLDLITRGDKFVGNTTTRAGSMDPVYEINIEGAKKLKHLLEVLE